MHDHILPLILWVFGGGFAAILVLFSLTFFITSILNAKARHDLTRGGNIGKPRP